MSNKLLTHLSQSFFIVFINSKGVWPISLYTYKGIFYKKLKIIKCPAFETKYVVDKIGAGDTMLSVVAPLFYLKNK